VIAADTPQPATSVRSRGSVGRPAHSRESPHPCHRWAAGHRRLGGCRLPYRPSLAPGRPDELLCRGDICVRNLEDKPLSFDTDHLTGFANDLLRPRFKAQVQAMPG